MEIIEAYATQNKCYQIGTPLKPRGIMLHSIGMLLFPVYKKKHHYTNL